MKNFTIYIIVFFILLFAIFLNKKKEEEPKPLPKGILYSIHLGPETILSKQTEKLIFQDKTLSNIPVISIFSKMKTKLPHKFIAKLTTKEKANFVILNNKKLIEEKKEKAPKKNTPKKKKKINPYTVVKKEKKNPLNFYTLNNFVKKSDKTYFFSHQAKSLKGVTVKLYSITPKGKKSILKFQVINTQQEYFFIANVSLYCEQKLISAKFFNDSLVGPNKKITGLSLLSRYKQKKYTFKLLESGGKNRFYEIKFKMF